MWSIWKLHWGIQKKHNVFIGTNWEAMHDSTLIAKLKEHQGYNTKLN